jgi:hypothetical protein
MTGKKAAPVFNGFRRRPRRSNSSKDVGRLLGSARIVYDPRNEQILRR